MKMKTKTTPSARAKQMAIPADEAEAAMMKGMNPDQRAVHVVGKVLKKQKGAQNRHPMNGRFLGKPC